MKYMDVPEYKTHIIFTGKVCPTLTIVGATPNTDSVTYETEVVFACDLGFLMDTGVTEEDMAAVCTSTSQWNQTIPDCRRTS